MNLAIELKQIFKTLYHVYGSQNWWPADTPFEVMVGAILTQNTSWTGVEKAIINLKEIDALSPEVLHKMDRHHLEQAVRPSGYFRQKAERLQILSRFLLEQYGGDFSSMSSLPTEQLREELLALKGIGPETADSILLYALGHPVFVVDAYTVRLFSRLGLLEGLGGEKVKYHDLQALFMDTVELDAALFNEYHALIIRHCKERCTKRVPLCEGCCLVEKCGLGSKIQEPKSKN
jgi:endonuclease-3 related protein